MGPTEVQNVVQQTTNYDQFSFMLENRDAARGHVEALKRAFEEMGNLTRVQPILVNDRYEIIDGQHRFVAAKELGQPVFFTVMAGLGVREARSMNILHRNWTTDDYAASYAKSDVNYRKYLGLREDYGFNHSVTIMAISGNDRSGRHKEFRAGGLVIDNEQEIRVRLDMLASLREFVSFTNDRSFAAAFFNIIKMEGYSHKRMLDKLATHGQSLLRRFVTVADYQRMLEEIYNYKTAASNRVRLF